MMMMMIDHVYSRIPGKPNDKEIHDLILFILHHSLVPSPSLISPVTANAMRIHLSARIWCTARKLILFSRSGTRYKLSYLTLINTTVFFSFVIACLALERIAAGPFDNRS